MNKREFTKLCKSYGFSRLAPNYYARCLGDGIFQTIYTGFRRYINPRSPNYSTAKRKSEFISIGIRSLFSNWGENVFMPGPDGTCIYLDLLIGIPRRQYVFHGIEFEYEMMRENGFAILDSINTQERFLEIYSKANHGNNGARTHNFSLIGPFFMVGDTDNALFEICHMYTRRRMDFYKENNHLLESGNYAEYCQNDICEQENLYELQSLWKALFGRTSISITTFLKDNAERNMEWVKKYKIPLTEDFRLRSIPEKFLF